LSDFKVLEKNTTHFRQRYKFYFIRVDGSQTPSGRSFKNMKAGIMKNSYLIAKW